MEERMGGEGINFMAQVLQERMQGMNSKPPLLDFGTIQKDMSLITNAFPKPIPQTDYMVCRHLTLGAAGTHLAYTIGGGNAGDGTHNHGSSGPHSHTGGEHEDHASPNRGKHTHSGDGQHVHLNEGPHVHDVLVPEKMRGPKPGDRVLVAWVGADACVIDIILPGTAANDQNGA